MGETPRTRWLNYAACVWAVLFAAPHVWWPLGISAGFPGGEASYWLFMSSWWRYLFDWVVVLLSFTAVVVALALLRPRGWMPRTAAWIACVMLTVRGTGVIVDGLDIWGLAFLTGGILFGAVACFAETLPPKGALREQ